MIFIIVAISVLPSLRCMGRQPGAEFDPAYSEFLTSFSGNYRAITGEDSIETVDGIQIFRTKGKHFDEFTLEQLRERELAFETRNRVTIKTLLKAIQAESADDQECSASWDASTLHIVAYDNTMHRAGYILVRRCGMSPIEQIVVKPLQGAGKHAVYRSMEAAKVLAELRVY